MRNKKFRFKNLDLRVIASQVLALLLLFSCSQSKTEQAKPERSVKFTQYYLKGEILYTKHCSNCHQANGTGLGRVYPPLHKSDYMENNLERVLCGMKHGLSGEIIVNGKSFVQPMPGVSTLTDLEIAQIATYIYNTWEHQRGLIDVNTVALVMQQCAATAN